MRRNGRMTLRVLAVPLSIAFAAVAFADDAPEQRGMWLVQRDVSQGSAAYIHSMELTLHAREEPRPALRYRLVPDEFEQVEGNAAIFYLKAMGFLEQNWRREQLAQFEKDAFERVREERKATGDMDPFLPPYSWDEMEPSALPLEEVNKYLSFVAFQPRYLREAARRKVMDLDRQLQNEDNPLGYLLPDIQEMRTLIRFQNLRCKVAIAENRIDDAIKVLGQLYTMARHLGQDESIVANLVGKYCAEKGWECALQLIQHAQAPNLYWAFASLPRPLISTRRSAAFEPQMIYFQFPMLREVDETPKPAGYWQDFLDRLAAKLSQSSNELELPRALRDPATARAALVGMVAAYYPDARRYLIEQCKLPREKVEAYPTAQVVLLAAVRYYDEMRDEVFKWSFLPFHQGPKGTDQQWTPDSILDRSDETGWFAKPARKMLRFNAVFSTLPIEVDQTIAVLQAVEAIRMYGAGHQGQLPTKLSDLPVPAPCDPATGKPFVYVCSGDSATIGFDQFPNQYRLTLRTTQEAGK